MNKFGVGPYKGLFALDIVIALVLIVLGWKAATPAWIYAPPLNGSTIPMAVIVLAIVLFVASSTPNNLKRYVRHPQMTAEGEVGGSSVLRSFQNEKIGEDFSI